MENLHQGVSKHKVTSKPGNWSHFMAFALRGSLASGAQSLTSGEAVIQFLFRVLTLRFSLIVARLASTGESCFDYCGAEVEAEFGVFPRIMLRLMEIIMHHRSEYSLL